MLEKVLKNPHPSISSIIQAEISYSKLKGYKDVLQSLIEAILDMSLEKSQPDFRIEHIPKDKRQVEMEFCFLLKVYRNG